MNVRFVRPMKFPRSLGWLRCSAGFLVGQVVVLSVIAADAPKPATPAPATPLSGLVEKYTGKTETLTPSQPVARPASQPVAPPTAQPAEMSVSRDAATKKAPARQPSPSLASLPAP